MLHFGWTKAEPAFIVCQRAGEILHVSIFETEEGFEVERREGWDGCFVDPTCIHFFDRAKICNSFSEVGVLVSLANSD